jgi:hypothetical protein
MVKGSKERERERERERNIVGWLKYQFLAFLHKKKRRERVVCVCLCVCVLSPFMSSTCKFNELQSCNIVSTLPSPLHPMPNILFYPCNSHIFHTCNIHNKWLSVKVQPWDAFLHYKIAPHESWNQDVVGGVDEAKKKTSSTSEVFKYYRSWNCFIYSIWHLVGLWYLLPAILVHWLWNQWEGASYCEYLVDTSWLLMVTCALSLISEHPKHRSRWVLRFNQPTTRDVQTGIRDVQKCNKATW